MRFDANTIIQADNLAVLPRLDTGSYQLIYIDPPFNTGQTQTRKTMRTSRVSSNASLSGDAPQRSGFQGTTYVAETLATRAYDDSFDDYLSFIEPRLVEAHRLLSDSGTLYFHIDYREAHYCKVLLDEIFGRANFLNEIIWAYDFGGRSKRRWPAKHDTILVYVKDINRYHFDSSGVDRQPYMAPGLVTAEKAARGKLPTDVWWHTIVPTSGHEKTGYPSQKPLGIVRRMVEASTRQGDRCLDFFAGSGTLGSACEQLGRTFTLIDNNPQAIETMQTRLRTAQLANMPTA